MLAPIFVLHKKVLRRIHPEEVFCLETQGNYTWIYLTENRKFCVRATLSGALKKFPQEMFVKIHRSYAASIYYIDKIAKDHLILGGEVVPIAKKFYESAIAKLIVIR